MDVPENAPESKFMFCVDYNVILSCQAVPGHRVKTQERRRAVKDAPIKLYVLQASQNYQTQVYT